MPELPEVEILVRYLAPALENKVIRGVRVFRARVLGSTSQRQLKRRLEGARFLGAKRRGKYLLFSLQGQGETEPFPLVGHLGMTGRMYLQPASAGLPKHAAVVLELGPERFVFEDTRYFGRLTLQMEGLQRLGPEPLEAEFTPQGFALALKRSAQPIKVRLLDQTLVAGVGNIYASEALFKAGISPLRPARKLTIGESTRLWNAIREVLAEAIDRGSTVPLDYPGIETRDRLSYFGSASGPPPSSEERLLVYDREGQPCVKCGATIRRIVQAARSTFYCPRCQRAGKGGIS